jgi:hypothetical protein
MLDGSGCRGDGVWGPAHHFPPYIKANPELTLGILPLLCQELCWTSSIIEDAAFLAFPGPFAKRLTILRNTTADPRSMILLMPLSQHDIGSMVGAGTSRSINSSLYGAPQGSPTPGAAPS